MKCTDILMEEHTIILRALEVLEQMAARAQKNEPVEPADVETLISFRSGIRGRQPSDQRRERAFSRIDANSTR
jgi:hypothetical protein